MKTDELEAAAKRVYAIMPVMALIKVPSTATNVRYTKEWRPDPWSEIDNDYRDYCRRIAAAALNTEEQL